MCPTPQPGFRQFTSAHAMKGPELRETGDRQTTSFGGELFPINGGFQGDYIIKSCANYDMCCIYLY